MPELVKAKIVPETGPTIDCWYNPKEISIDKSVPWQKHKTSESDSPTLEFTSSEPKTLGVELLFDTYESRTDVYGAHISKLEKLTKIINKDDKKRPPMCTFIWGSAFKFKGVVESMAVKYTMFLEDGKPCRAIVTLKIKEASKVIAKSEANHREDANAAGADDARSGGTP